MLQLRGIPFTADNSPIFNILSENFPTSPLFICVYSVARWGMVFIGHAETCSNSITTVPFRPSYNFLRATAAWITVCGS